MCMEDIRIGRRAPAGIRTVPLTTTKTLFVPHNPNRIALKISAPVANEMFLSTDPSDAAGAGIQVPAGVSPLEWDVKQDGLLVVGPLYAAIDTAGETVAYAETLLQER